MSERYESDVVSLPGGVRADHQQPRFRIGRAIAGHLLGLALALALSFASLAQLRTNTRRMDQLIERETTDVVQFQRLVFLSERTGRTAQKFLLTGRPELEEETRATRRELGDVLASLTSQAERAPTRAALAEVVRRGDTYYRRLEQAIDRRKTNVSEAVALVETEVQPARDALDAALSAATSLEVRDLADARRRAAEQTSAAYTLLFAGTALAVAVGGLMTLLLVRTFSDLARSRSELAGTLVLLEQRNEDLDAFAGRVAHDLRNILAPLPIAVEHLRQMGTRPEDVDRTTSRVARVGSRATAFLDTLLAFARSGGRASDPYLGASVRVAVAGALDSLAGLGEELKVQVETDVEDCSVACAPALLMAVMTNLLSNAFKFMDGRPLRQVRVAARGKEAVCEITVEDSGPGIAPEHQSRIFEPFYRTPGTRAPGSGLGLATVQRIVTATGGSVTVFSQPEQGTRFTVTLPSAAARSGTRDTPEEAFRSQPSAASPKRSA